MDEASRKDIPVKHKYWSVYEYYEEKDREKRRIYTFDNESSANDMLEFILQNDYMRSNIGVEEDEVTA